MTLQSSGAISMSQINAEFGRGNNLNAYRGTSHSTGTFPSGAISFSNFYGKSVPPSAGTFNPDGSTSSGSRVVLSYSDYSYAAYTITCTLSAVWSWTKIGGSNAFINGNANITSGNTSSTIFEIEIYASNNFTRSCNYHVDAVSGNNTRYWSIYLEALGEGCPLCCFTPDTLIRMADGSEKPIVEVQVGEFILVYDETLMSNVATPVSNVITRVDRPMYELTFEDGNSLRASEDHPLYVVGKGYASVAPTPDYKDLGLPNRLEVGDQVVNELGVPSRIIGIKPIDYTGTVYTFGNSRFYANGVLVY